MNNRGVVIIAVLWICALIMWMALEISADTRIRAQEDIHLVRRSQALFMAIGGANEALARLGKAPPLDIDKDSAPGWQPNGIPQTVIYKTGEAIVTIEDENRKVNVNRAEPANLVEVLERVGLESAEAEDFADMIADFVDSDEMPRLHGAEKERYEQMGLPYSPFDAPLSSVDQLLLVPGISADLLYGYGTAMGDSEEMENGDGDDEAMIPSDPMLPGENSLFSMFTVFGTSTVLRDEDSDEGPLDNQGSSLFTSGTKGGGSKGFSSDEEDQATVSWVSGGIYRILSCGRPAMGPPSVVLCLIIRYTPESDIGYEVLYRKTL